MTHTEMLKAASIGVASTTLWQDGFNPDVAATLAHIERRVALGAQMVVVGGTTGGGHQMRHAMKVALYKAVGDRFARRVALVAGIGTTNPQQARQIIRCAESCNFDGVLALPNSNDPQLLHKLAACLEATGKNPPGLIVYIIPQLDPSYTATPQQIDKLKLAHPRLYVAVKDSRGSIDGLLEWYRQDPFMDVWIGSDLIAAPGFYALSCLGLYPKTLRVISGSANVPGALEDLLRMDAAAKRPGSVDYAAMLDAQRGLSSVVYELLQDASDSFAEAVQRALQTRLA